MMTIEMMNHNELNEKEMAQVNGGFLIRDKWDDQEYAARGVKHESNWLSKDVYTLPDGTKTDYDGVKKYMAQFEKYRKKDDSHKGFGMVF